MWSVRKVLNITSSMKLLPLPVILSEPGAEPLRLLEEGVVDVHAAGEGIGVLAAVLEEVARQGRVDRFLSTEQGFDPPGQVGGVHGVAFGPGWPRRPTPVRRGGGNARRQRGAAPWR